ncbi:MAG: glycogen/starch/alpha-glucan phosphorylase [Acidobacteriota bacterium]|nr:MAG: glycogen/starch/alpha-glucan phosphorylase [Acidobacteriota bacterium]
MEKDRVKFRENYRERLRRTTQTLDGFQGRQLPEVVVEDDRTGMDVETFKRAFLDNLHYLQGVADWNASLYDCYMALSYTMRDRLMYRWIKSVETTLRTRAKKVYYLSAEFLMGRQLEKNLLNSGCWMRVHEALTDLGLQLHELMEVEPEPGLGNGGLGRLAACFLDSLATMDIPARGYGIRYEFGIFEQRIEDGWQVERPDKWLRLGNPWEMHRPQEAVEVGFEGHTEHYIDNEGRERTRWFPDRTVIGSPYDTLVPGFNTNTVNALRLWSASSSRDFDFQVFDDGDYTRAVSEKTFSENISKVLYPNDNTPQGKELRLRQQYFFVACSLMDIIRTHLLTHETLDELHLQSAIQLNDTHPSIAVAELMRLLVDVYGYEWEKAWEITSKTIAYTNHTLLPEALETWTVDLFGRLLPRHLEIIGDINQNFLKQIQDKFPGDWARIARMSIFEEGPVKKIRMAHLATVGSHAVNGVAELHSRLVQEALLKDFYEMWPEKFSNKTNGVTPRRWMLLANPKLSYLITEKIGKGWATDLDLLQKLESFSEDENFQETWNTFKEDNKFILARYIEEKQGIKVDPSSLFDVQVKRIHEYKRQLLLVLYIIHLYQQLKQNPGADIQPRTFIFGGKAAPGYFMAKLVIKLINSVAEVVNNDPDIDDRIKVVFLENFCVSLGERVYPAADLSEQISTAGKEASGTGNMKFSLNGALTIGTFDGANIEIREAVGEENFFLFGLKVEEIQSLREKGYNPQAYYHGDPQLKAVLDSLISGEFSRGDRDLFRPIFDALISHDEYLLLADFQAYVKCQEQVSATYQNRPLWTKMAILNVARMGRFSSDRTIREYAEEIWRVRGIDVNLEEFADRALEHHQDLP